MKQFISMTSRRDCVDVLRESAIGEAYINSLPPQGTCLHGIEESALVFGTTLGIEYWRNEIILRRGMPVIKATELTAIWEKLSFRRLIKGPREVRLYSSPGSQGQKHDSSSALIGLELIALASTSERVLFLASQEGSPGDVEILTPSNEYEIALARLSLRRVPRISG